MVLVECKIMDVGMFIFGIKDVCCKRVNIDIAKAVVFKVNSNRSEEGRIVTVREKFSSITEGNILLHQADKIIIIIKVKSTFF